MTSPRIPLSLSLSLLLVLRIASAPAILAGTAVSRVGQRVSTSPAALTLA